MSNTNDSSILVQSWSSRIYYRHRNPKDYEKLKCYLKVAPPWLIIEALDSPNPKEIFEKYPEELI